MKSLRDRIVWLGILLIFMFLNIKYIDKGPISTHIWAQADHYAIAIGFVDNNLDFFHPKTYCLNPQFGGLKLKKNEEYWTVIPENPEGITAIDFPIHHYFVACIMKLLGSKEPIIFRFYTFILSFIGLFFLFKSSLLINGSKEWSFFMLAFVMLAPTFNFYAANFLPSSFALSTLFIALFYFIKYSNNYKISEFYYSIFFLTLSALVRFPFLIYHIALICTYIVSLIYLRKKFLKEILGVSVGLFVVLLYFIYNKFYLSYNFGSNFLSYPLPPKDFIDFIDSIYRTFLHAAGRYLTLIHYILLAVLLYVFIKNKLFINLLKYNFVLFLLAFQLLGVTLYSFLMVRQFPGHDYYFLDTYFPLIIITLLLYSKQFLKVAKFNHRAFIIGFVVLAFIGNRIIFKYGFNSDNDNTLELSRRNFKGGDSVLDSLKIPRSAKLLVLDSHSPNLAFTSMKRSGYCVMTTSYANIERAMKWDYDYIITQNFSFKSDVLTAYPNFNKQTSVCFSNNKFTIHLKNK